jgi:phenylalanyl-tRNA synthetase beta chain
MRSSLKWLKRYLNIDVSKDKIAEILTTIGLEVEGVEEVEMVKGGLKGVVVGEVKTCTKHPDADKLSVTTVDTGTGKELQIVCGAPNVAAGQKVLVATVGTTLYTDSGEEFKIKKSKIRGVESEGMICSEAELGLGKDHSGIAVLPAHTPPGKSAAEVLQMESDTVFEIGLTPNRADATSQLGVARDLLAYLRVNEGITEDLKDPDLSAFIGRKTPFNIQVEVHNKPACPRYSGVLIHNVEVKESPDWLKQLLISVGVRPINNIVDITNFVLHEYGQPLHAFDADKIKGHKINVTTLEKGTKFVSLDGVERTLEAHDLMICDGDMNPMCIAGVFGGLTSGVTGDTKNIFLESACFSAAFVRKTSMSHNLRTDAARIFEKGSDPNITLHALKRACILISELGGGTVSAEVTDIYPHPVEPCAVRLRYAKVQDIIGVEIPRDRIHEILLALEMEISPVDQESILVHVPTNKPDVTREIDLIEEIIRIYGLNKIPVSNQIRSAVNYTDFPSKMDIVRKICDFLASRGFYEMMGLSMIESSAYPHLDEGKMVFVNNTSNIHLNIMRPDMLVSGLVSVGYNLNRQQNQIALYETGKMYQKNGEEIEEKEKITIFLSGSVQEESWRVPKPQPVSFFDIKNIVEAVLAITGIRDWDSSESDSEDFNYGLKYVVKNHEIVRFGEVSGKILKSSGIKQNVFFAEFDLAALISCASASKTKLKEISRYPSVRRDLAFVVSKDTAFETIRQAAWGAEKKHLRDVNLFDIYVNISQLGEGKKSYAVSFIFESLEKTLQETDIERMMQKIENKIVSETGAQIRR